MQAETIPPSSYAIYCLYALKYKYLNTTQSLNVANLYNILMKSLLLYGKVYGVASMKASNTYITKYFSVQVDLYAKKRAY
jgi:hypothetical protein